MEENQEGRESKDLAYPVASQRPAELSIHDLVYYQVGDSEPVVKEYRHSTTILTDEEAYTRNPGVGESWSPLELGWLRGQEIGLITIHNTGPPEPEYNPTQNEQAQLDAKVVEVSFDKGRTAHLILRRGMSCRFVPADPSTISLRCLRGATKVRTAIYPG